MKGKLMNGLLALMLTSAAVSCNDENPTASGNLKLTVNFASNPNGRTSENPSDRIESVFVTIESLSGGLVLEKKIGLLHFGSSFVTENIGLPVGNFRVTRFLVLAENDEVIFLTPVRPSPASYFVDKPLPVNIQVKENDVTNLALEVVAAESPEPSFYGYASFQFKIVSYCEKLSARVDGVAWCGRSTYVIAYGGPVPVFELHSQNSYGKFAVIMRYYGNGTYDLTNTNSNYYKAGGATYDVVSGSLTIAEAPTAGNYKVSGTFNMILKDENNNTVEISDGVFNNVNGSGN